MDFIRLKEIVQQSNNIVFFGGAGTSTESGIPDFRSADGLYNAAGSKVAPEEILSRRFFIEHTEEFYEFYKSKMIYKDAKPNSAHEALAKLEADGKLKAVITQNIDGLHQLAGSRNVLELHGSVHRNYCMRCRCFYSLESIMDSQDIVPKCTKCGDVIKPDVVLYQENLDKDVLESAASYIRQAEVLIVAGTSLTVQPAAGLVRLYEGTNFILINKSTTPMDGLANYVIGDSISRVMKHLAE